MQDSFLQFSLIISLACLAGLVAKLLRQPALVAYMLLGLIFGIVERNLGLPFLTQFELFSDLGITFLLFLVGIELSSTNLYRGELKHIWLGIGQIGLTLIVGIVLLTLFGATWPEAVIGGFAFTFSSTVLVLRILGAKGALTSLSAKMSLLILLMQDVVAVLVLLFVTPTNGNEMTAIFWLLIRAGILLLIVYLLSTHVFNVILHSLARDPELLSLFGISWALLFASIVHYVFGFSLEAGGFLAGLTLANSVHQVLLASKIKPLRDFFILIFFMYLGVQVQGVANLAMVTKTIGLLLAILILKPLIILILMGISGFKRRVSFATAVSLSQMSEFSFILIGLGMKEGLIRAEIGSIFTMAGLLSMILSAYFIEHTQRLFLLLKHPLRIFEKATTITEGSSELPLSEQVIVVGYGRKGIEIVKALRKLDLEVVVVDHDPHLKTEIPKDVHFVAGDINDEDLQEMIHLIQARLIISTIMNEYDDLTLLSQLKTKRARVEVVMTAKTAFEAHNLRQHGALYVLLPQSIAGDFMGHLITDGDLDQVFESMGKQQEKVLAREIAVS